MPYQERRLAFLFHFAPREIYQLLHQMRPIVRDRVFRVMAEPVDRLDVETADAQALEQHALGAGGKTVGVGEDDQWHESGSISGGESADFQAWNRLGAASRNRCWCGSLAGALVQHFLWAVCNFKGKSAQKQRILPADGAPLIFIKAICVRTVFV